MLRGDNDNLRIRVKVQQESNSNLSARNEKLLCDIEAANIAAASLGKQTGQGVNCLSIK